MLAANVLFFSVIGGALLTRYLLPLYPLILLLCVSTFYRRVRYWWGLVLLSAIAFVIGLFVNPPYKFAPEDNLNYADVIRLHQQAIRQIVAHFPGSTILTAWPATDELTKPELGYVKKPLAVVTVANFSLAEIQKAAASAQNFSVGFAFSTKYDPPRLLLTWAHATRPSIHAFSIFITILRPPRSLTCWMARSSGGTSARANGRRCCTSIAPR